MVRKSKAGVKFEGETRGLSNKVKKLGRDIDGVFDRSAKKVKDFGSKLKQTFSKDYLKIAGFFYTAQQVISVLGKIGEIIGKATHEFNRMTESTNAVNVVFGKSADVIHEFGQISSQAVALSTQAFNEMASAIGGALKIARLEGDLLANTMVALSVTGSDLASVFNKDVVNVMDKIRSGAIGATEPLTELGIILLDKQLEAEAAALGIKKSAASMTQQEKALLRLIGTFEQSRPYFGDYENTLDSLTNKQRTNRAEIEQAIVSFGAFTAQFASGWENLKTAALSSVIHIQYAYKKVMLAMTAFRNFSIFRWEDARKMMTEGMDDLDKELQDKIDKQIANFAEINKKREKTIAQLKQEFIAIANNTKGEGEKGDEIERQIELRKKNLSLLDKMLDKQGLQKDGRLLLAPGSDQAKNVYRLKRDVSPQTFKEQENTKELERVLGLLISQYMRKSTITPTNDTYLGSKVNI